MAKGDNRRIRSGKIDVSSLQDGNLLLDIYKRLFNYFGPQGWWPADDSFEVAVGAILTQNTAWRNVEKAIKNLKEEGLLNPSGLHRLSLEQLASLIRPSGYYNVKANRLKAFIDLLFNDYKGDLDIMFSEEGSRLRERLLGVKGIGEETADSMLLYVGGVPIFVVDSYTKRILFMHKIIPYTSDYREVQQIFMKRLPHDPQLFNEYHALIVKLGKDFCKKKPLCERCPLSYLFSLYPHKG